MAVADSFFSSDMKDGRQVYAKVLKPVVKPFKGRNKAEYIPHLFVLCSGPMDSKKRDLANRTVVDWQLCLKKKKLKKGKCPWYAPSSQNVERRTFLSRMARDYEWQWNENNLSGFDGSTTKLRKIYINTSWHVANNYLINYKQLKDSNSSIISFKTGEILV